MCHCLDLQLANMAESHSETDFSTAFQAYSKLIVEVNLLEIEMRHEIEQTLHHVFFMYCTVYSICVALCIASCTV